MEEKNAKGNTEKLTLEELKKRRASGLPRDEEFFEDFVEQFNNLHTGEKEKFHVLLEYLTYYWEPFDPAEDTRLGIFDMYDYVCVKPGCDGLNCDEHGADVGSAEYEQMANELHDAKEAYNNCQTGTLENDIALIRTFDSQEQFMKMVKSGDVGIASANAIIGVQRVTDYFYMQDEDYDPWNPRRWESYATVLSPWDDNITIEKPTWG